MEPSPHEVSFTSTDAVLAGSLTVPHHDVPAPGVVMVGGSGPADRTNDGYFSAISRHLVDAGIAVLSYDKRGVGASTGEWRDTTLNELAADAVAARNCLRAQAGVHADHVGLFGHSEGGWVVLHAAAVSDDVPWVITNSCPGMTPAAQDRYALATALRQTHAHDERYIDTTLAVYDRVIEAGRRDADYAEVTRLVGSVATPSAFDDYATEVDEQLWEFLKRKQDHDPIPDTLRLRCPHLAIFGGADQLVPVAESIHLFAAAACHLGRDERAALTVRVFPGVDHRIQVRGSTDLAPGYLQTLAQWIKHQ